MSTAKPKAAGWPAARAVHFAARENNLLTFASVVFCETGVDFRPARNGRPRE